MAMQIPPGARYGLVAAAVVAAVLLGVTLFGAGPNLGGEPDPTPTPTPSPTPPPLGDGALNAGTYRLTVQGVDATITVPDGWEAGQGFLLGTVSGDSYIVLWPSDAEVGHVYADPCQWQDGYVDPPVGPTVDDLATALANQPQRGESVPVDVSIDGYQGTMIELSVPEDINFADCDGGQFYSWEGRYHQGPGQIDRIYVLDVGGQRLVIDMNFLPATSEADRAELQAVFDSIQLDGP